MTAPKVLGMELTVGVLAVVIGLAIFALWTEFQTRRFVRQARALRSRKACRFHESHGFEFKESCPQCKSAIPDGPTTGGDDGQA